MRLELHRLAGEPGPDTQWNQALLDLGATVCTARSPKCSECPILNHCATGRSSKIGNRQPVDTHHSGGSQIGHPTMRTIDLPPNPSSLMESMRDIGYSMGSALADLIDNSITAGPFNIRILANTHGENPRVAILDDGSGMIYETLLEAMRFGTHSPLMERSPSDFGRFGLGLKTASLSQCRLMTVVSRRNGETSAARWDLDYVTDTNNWAVQILDDFELVPWFEELGEHGTLVVWEKLGTQRGGSSQDLSGEDLVRQLDEARQHLELTFHRFLGSDITARHFDLSLNDAKLRPFDPFSANHYATQVSPQERVRLDGHEVVIQPYTLPHHSKVSPAEWERLGGDEGYLKEPGILRVSRATPDHPWHLVRVGEADRTDQTDAGTCRCSKLP